MKNKDKVKNSISEINKSDTLILSDNEKLNVKGGIKDTKNDDPYVKFFSIVVKM